MTQRCLKLEALEETQLELLSAVSQWQTANLATSPMCAFLIQTGEDAARSEPSLHF